MTPIPENWSKLWLLMWATFAPGVIVSAFFLPFWLWVVVALVGFLAPEMWSIRNQSDCYPPLTHAFRHFVPNWIAFPIIYGSLFAVAGHWFDFPRQLGLALVGGLLGWLNDHFTVTYAADDPYPYANQREQEVNDRPRPA